MRSTLGDFDRDASVDMVSCLSEALERLGTGQVYDLTVLDLHLPDAIGYEGLKSLRARQPACPVVVLSGDADAPAIRHCIELGASGFIPKSLHTEGILNALRTVSAGDIYIPHQAVCGDSGYTGRHRHRARSHGGTDPHDLGLTERQIQVLRLILEGMPNKLICRRLNLAEGTIKVHVSAVLRALGVRNRTQAILTARELGLAFPDDEH